ncbi:MAG: SusC/RagA family TonB-linked outer membrane protein [Bacteroidetes bacterium]|nr:MAG: SusC/RagA family TonB-linked outer membrane protein [Bacteroidota bacterium]
MVRRFNLWRPSPVRAAALLPCMAWCALLLLLTPHLAAAQGFDVRGVVRSAANNEPLPGVNIVEVGTQNGTTTDADGTFALTVAGPNASLRASFVGFVPQTIALNGRSELTILLEEDTELLDEVVVTAFGIERQERALGFAVSEVSGEALREANETNVANALAGKVAGVLVQKPATGPAGSSRVIIRGPSSLGEDSQPLYVVDGVPIDNTTLGAAGMWGGSDGGDGISSINPDDIESMSVLKGPAAAALYGTRAKNGVILITTKRAQTGGGLGVEFSSNTTFEDVLVTTDWQDQYGQGTRGEKPETAEEARTTNLSAWGAPLDGSMVINWDGVQRPYSLIEDRLNRFYETGLTTTNSLALTASSQTAAVRLGFSHLENNGISPNSGLSRTSFTLRGTANLGKRLSADAKLNFVREDVQNRPRLSDSPGNANYTIYQLAPNVDPLPMRGTQETPGTDEEGRELAVTGSIFAQNPYFAAYNITSGDEDRRLIGFASLTYRFTDWLSLMGRFGGDTYTTRRTNITAWGTGYNPLGNMSEQEFRITEINTDFLLQAQRNLTDAVGLSANFGGNILYRQREDLTLGGSGGFNIPTLHVVTNQANPTVGYGYNEKQINSLYGSAELSYNDYLFLTLTGRNDWSSTLPIDNNSYFYPSVSASFVFSDAFAMPSWLTFGKLRASWAEVGGDTDPYQLFLTYSLSGSHMGRPRGAVAQSQIPLANLKPSSTVGVEAGFDLRFFDNRIGTDFTVYSQTASDQILSTTISNASGFNSQVINAGEIKNTGVELLLTTTPVRTADWRWDLDFNVSRNINEVVELIEGQTSLILAESRRRGNFVTADVGEPYGTIKGQKYLRQNVPTKVDPNTGETVPDPCNATGPIVHDADGLPMSTGDLCVLGNGTPDVIGGISNTVRYRNFTLSALLDMRFGGEIYSYTNSQGYASGLHKATLQGREQGYLVGEGVDQDGNPNTVQANPQDYFGRIASQIGEEFVYDASFVKLRELQLSYRLPSRLLARTPITVATVSVIGRNLWLIHSNVDNVDPESTFRNDQQGIGLEHSGVPQTRSLGFSINVRL